MRIGIEEIKDYIRCPIRYKFKHVDYIPISMDPDEYYRDCLKLTIFFYYFCIMEKKANLFDVLLRKWESLWFNKDISKDFNEDYLRHKSSEAITYLTDFYKRVAAENVTPIAVNFPYEAVLPGEENIHVIGTIDLIRVINDQTKHRETQLVDFSTARYPLTDFLLKNDISLSVASYVFRKTFKIKEDRIKIIGVSRKTDMTTSRNGADFIRAEKIIRNICKGIKNKVYYPVPNNINCSYCKYKVFCINEKSLT